MFSTITAAPAKQSVSETIAVLSGRLSTGTLLEDRRAAILGLRSFAKQYPASVASGALRSLIESLRRDGEDVDTVKVVLETLLMLFNPNKDSPEASEEIALWLADEFTQRQENITLLLDFLETSDFYSNLYSLQLLSAILSARTERTEECIHVAPMGLPRLVAVLDDRREAIRDEAINLLTDLTPASIHIQNVVAFEKGFERIFGIIHAEGGLVHGARVVEDCLILLANLLRLNPSNQSLFREMGFISQLGRLLHAAYKGDESGEQVGEWAEAQRNRNIYALLAVIRLFLVAGAVGTNRNQLAFLGDHVLENTLLLAFTQGVELPIRTEALVACADMIRGNPRLQERFAGLEVPSPLAQPPPPPVNGQAPQANGVPKVYVIDGLLDIILGVNSLLAFDLRMAACTCLKAYFHKHAEIRRHFLTRAIHGHKIKADELTNVLTTLLQPMPEAIASDPYRYWFAAVLMLHLIHENPETKALAMAVTEGDEESGEEVVTCIQTIAAHLISCVAKSEDPRVIIGYLMLLLCWLFEDLDGVNDFLCEFTNLKGLIQSAVENPAGDPIVQGLSAMLAGVIYEFSTKDSPVSRAKVGENIQSLMGRDRYVDKLSRLRSHPLMRDFEVLPQKLLDPGAGLPDVYLDDAFVEFFKDNYSRILRAIDREPGLEISVMTNGVEKGVSRELVDSLREQVEQKDRALEEIEAEKSSLASQLGQEQADHRRAKDQAAAELARANAATEAVKVQLATRDRNLQGLEAQTADLKKKFQLETTTHAQTKTELARLQKVNEGLQRNQEEEMRKTQRAHDDEMRKMQRTHDEEVRKLQAQLKAREEELQREIQALSKTAENDAMRIQRRSEAERADFKATISRLEVDLMKAGKAKSVLEAQVAELVAAAKTAEAEVEGLKKTLKKEVEGVKAALKKEEEGVKKVTVQLEQASRRLEEKEEEKKAIQNELDDLLIVFSDLEEKADKYKERLKALGESVSDGEDDDEDDDDDDDDE